MAVAVGANWRTARLQSYKQKSEPPSDSEIIFKKARKSNYLIRRFRGLNRELLKIINFGEI